MICLSLLLFIPSFIFLLLFLSFASNHFLPLFYSLLHPSFPYVYYFLFSHAFILYSFFYTFISYFLISHPFFFSLSPSFFIWNLSSSNYSSCLPLPHLRLLLLSSPLPSLPLFSLFVSSLLLFPFHLTSLFSIILVYFTPFLSLRPELYFFFLLFYLILSVSLFPFYHLCSFFYFIILSSFPSFSLHAIFLPPYVFSIILTPSVMYFSPSSFLPSILFPFFLLFSSFPTPFDAAGLEYLRSPEKGIRPHQGTLIHLNFLKSSLPAFRRGCIWLCFILNLRDD